VKVALLDRRFGTHGGHDRTYWLVRKGVEWYNKDQTGSGNTFAFIDTFGDVMTGPLESGTDYRILQDYDLAFLRARGYDCMLATKQLRETCPNLVIICYTDELVNESINDIRPRRGWIYEISQYVDRVVCSFPAKYDKPKFDKLGATNYEYCPYAGDVHHWKQWYTETKQNIVAGMFHLRSFMRGGCGTYEHQTTFGILRRLQKKYGVKIRFFLNFDGHKAVPRIRQFVGDLNVELVQHVHSPAFNTMLAETKVFIEEYQAPNYARSTVVSACVGTPQVGTDMNTPSNVLFPETTVPHGDWDGFVERCERLLTDDEFYKDVQAKALKRSSYFYYPRFRGRVLRMYNMIRNERNL